MPSTRRQKAKAKKSREMDMMSDFDNLDVMIGNENYNTIERELTYIFEGSANHYYAESNSPPRGNSSQEDEFRVFDRENAFPRRDRFIESMEILHNEINLRLSQEMDSMMSMMHSQINRALSSAIAERILPEIQIMVSSIFSRNRDSESGSSSNNQENNNGTSGFKTKITKKGL